jgi:hypothetical protein
MKPNDQLRLAAVLADVHAFYRQDFSEFALNVWTMAMEPFDIAAIERALGQHAMNPDSGQWCPKPADIVKMLQGSTKDSANLAWSAVDYAIRTRGDQYSVVFDDPLIHRVVEDMGGWIKLCRVDAEQYPFTQNEFVNRYRGYKMRGEVPPYPSKLIGSPEDYNARQGYPIAPPLLIGDPKKAQLVLQNGSNTPRIAFTEATKFLPENATSRRLNALKSPEDIPTA